MFSIIHAFRPAFQPLASLVRSVCENCILNKDCGYCYDKSDLPSATCAHAIEDNEENALYGGCSKNTTATRSDLKWALGYCPTDYNWMAVIGLALFVFSFAPGELNGPGPQGGQTSSLESLGSLGPFLQIQINLGADNT